MNSKLWLTIFSLVLAGLGLCAMSGCEQGAKSLHSNKSNSSNSQLKVNAYGARKLDPDVVKAEIGNSWNNYLASLDVEAPDEPVGFSDTEIEFIECEIRQRLPEDLKAFLRVCLANGSFFNDGFEIMTAEQIVDWWKFQTELNYVNEPIFGAPDANGTPTWFEPYLIPLMQYDVYEIHFDIRTGKVIEMLDGPCGVLADSLTELLDELAMHHRAGRTVAVISFEGKEVGPFLNSQLWDVYAR